MGHSLKNILMFFGLLGSKRRVLPSLSAMLLYDCPVNENVQWVERTSRRLACTQIHLQSSYLPLYMSFIMALPLVALRRPRVARHCSTFQPNIEHSSSQNLTVELFHIRPCHEEPISRGFEPPKRCSQLAFMRVNFVGIQTISSH